MGLLTTGGRPLTWGEQENVAAIPYILEHGIRQFIELFKRGKDYENYPFTWGDEIESLLVSISDPSNPTKTVQLSINAHEILDLCRAADDQDIWHPEYGSFMVESTPADPYSLSAGSLDSVEVSMRRRYVVSNAVGKKQGLRCVTMVAFPRLGVGNFVKQPTHGVRGPVSESLFVPDELINQTHPRFSTLTRNIRLRRGRKVCIQVPMFLDRETLSRTVDPTFRIDRHAMNHAIDCGATKVVPKGFDDSDDEAGGSGGDPSAAQAGQHKTVAPPATTAAEVDRNVHAMAHLYTPATDYYYAQYATGIKKADHVRQRFDACPCPTPSVLHPCIYMDCMAFGMGCCCLQVTMQLPSLSAARYTYDQLAVIAPLFLALTSATPIQKGVLCDSDVRWLTIAASVDDRKKSEVPRIIKSRYDSVSVFLSELNPHVQAFNDNPVVLHEGFYHRLRAEGVDDALARHVAHLFIRDPLVIYEQKITQLDDTHESDHFESIQTTNWQTVRFKPPPFGSPIGWRVEFRPMEVQLSAFENAAFAVFVAVLTAAINKYRLNFYMPMSYVDLDFGRAHVRDPCNLHYWFRNDWNAPLSLAPNASQWSEYTLDELFNGSRAAAPRVQGEHPPAVEGFIPIVRRFLAEEGTGVSPQMERYLHLISDRASRKLQTAAEFLRNRVLRHPKYQHDSQVTEEIAHDVVEVAAAMASGEVPPGGCAELLPEAYLTEMAPRGAPNAAVAVVSSSPAGDRKRPRD